MDKQVDKFHLVCERADTMEVKEQKQEKSFLFPYKRLKEEARCVMVARASQSLGGFQT